MNNAETIYSFWDRYPEMTLMVILVFMASITVFISISATALLQAFQRAIQESVTLIGNGEDETASGRFTWHGPVSQKLYQTCLTSFFKENP